MALPVAGAVAAKAAKLAAWTLAQMGIEKPEDLIKTALLVFFLPVTIIAIFFVLPVVTVGSVPMARPSQVQFYIDAANQLNEEYDLAIDWEEALALDTVLLEQDFSGTSQNRALSLAEDFVEVIKITDEDTTYYEYEQRSLDEVMDMRELDQDQMEWVYHLLSMGLSQFQDVGTDMQDGWEPNPTGPFIWPVPDSYKITSKFGPRVCPVEGIDGMHNGLDIGAPRGTAIVAADAGIAIEAGWKGTAGRAVIIRHAGGYETRYYHMNSIAVTKGQEVSQGDYIGSVGSTGRSTGNHLHFEIRRFTRAIDPLQFFLGGDENV